MVIGDEIKVEVMLSDGNKATEEEITGFYWQ